MGKITGFLDYKRETSAEIDALERIKNFNEFHLPLSEEEQQIQGARCMDCGVPYCHNSMMVGNITVGCPLNNLIPEWNELVYQGKWELALKRLMSTNRFPEFTSRVCPALCEQACICGITDTSVTVKENEHAIIENAYEKGYIKISPPPVRTNKTVAVIGSGPSGLSVSEWLNKRGHNVTVFERNDRLGGLLMYGIPNMKLEKSAIDRRIDIMKAEGIEFKTNCDIGNNISADEIKNNFDAVVLCCGASKPRDLAVEGRDANGIHFAVDYLTSVTKSLLNSNFEDGKAIDTNGKKVIVIGGGDTGNDCVGSAIRQGASAVTQLEMLPKPANLKTDYGQQESIAVFGGDPRIFQTTVKEFTKDENGNLTGAVISKLIPQKDEETGRMMMVATGEEFFVEADFVFLAVGFTGCQDYVADAFAIEKDARGNIATNDFATNEKKIFSAGDMRRGQSLVVWALREGRDVARQVDKYLTGYSNL
ncbi:MAG: glutamate synthase subunit beta [Clostridia bacterium]